METKVNCQQCGSAMQQKKKAFHNRSLQLLGVILFLIGLGLLFVFPIGTIAGLIIMVVSARLGYSKKKIWQCEGCGYFFERAS